MQAGRLDRMLRFRRAALQAGAFGQAEVWSDHGLPVWAEKSDISDGERWRAGAVSAQVTTRFRVRWSVEMAGITPKDRLVCEGREYDIVGIKEIGRREGLELTAAARIDQ